MFAYIDETGNSGKNIFDPEQPVFTTVALLTRHNFDLLYGKKFQALASLHGNAALHANELGVNRLEEIAGDLLDILKDEEAHFSIVS